MAFPSESLEEDSLLNIDVEVNSYKKLKIKKHSEADSVNIKEDKLNISLFSQNLSSTHND